LLKQKKNSNIQKKIAEAYKGELLLFLLFEKAYKLNIVPSKIDSHEIFIKCLRKETKVTFLVEHAFQKLVKLFCVCVPLANQSQTGRKR
jgi:hypothetical protein